MGITDYATQIAQNVTAELKRQELPGYILAERVAMPQSTMQRRLKDGNFTVTELHRIAVALGTDAIALLMQDDAA